MLTTPFRAEPVSGRPGVSSDAAFKADGTIGALLLRLARGWPGGSTAQQSAASSGSPVLAMRLQDPLFSQHDTGCRSDGSPHSGARLQKRRISAYIEAGVIEGRIANSIAHV